MSGHVHDTRPPVKTRRICINLRSDLQQKWGGHVHPSLPRGDAHAYNGGLGQKPGGQVRCFAPEAKSSLAFESPAAEQNVPDSGYVTVHTGVNHMAFCKRKFTAITMSAAR